MQKNYTFFLAMLLFVCLSLFLFSEKTIGEKVAALEKQLSSAGGEERLDTLLKLAGTAYNIDPGKSVSYGLQAAKLAQERGTSKKEADAYIFVAIGYAIQGKYKDSSAFFHKSKDIYIRLGDPRGAASAVNNLGNLYKRTGDYHKALDCFKETLKILPPEETKPRQLAVTYRNIGDVYGNLNKYRQALSFHLKALKIFEDSGDKTAVSHANHSMGILNMELGKPREALELFEGSLKTARETGDKVHMTNTLTCIGLVYQDLKQFTRALEFFRDALKIYKEIGDKRGIAYASGCIGSIYFNLDQLDRALTYYYHCLDLNEALGDKKQYTLTLMAIGKVQLKSGKYKTALTFFNDALERTRALDLKGMQKNCYKHMAKLYEAWKQPVKALEFYKRFHQVEKEILDTDSQKQLNELQTRYEAERRKKQLAVLKKDYEIRGLRLSKVRLTRNGFITGFALVSIIFVLLFKRYLYLFAFWKKQKYIGRYRLLERLGAGAMGVVYKARNVTDKSRLAAVKILRDELFGDESSRKRFKREGAIVDNLEHPHIITIYERGESRHHLFIAMEYLEGRTLAENLVQTGFLAPDTALPLMEQVAGAIAFIHEKNIIHRDLKPGNIMLVQRRDNREHAVLLDFGMAKMEVHSHITQTGNYVGTLEYIAPEQIMHSRTMQANDIFSMGVTFYRMLTGAGPFPGETVIEVMRGIIGGQPGAPGGKRPGIPKELDILVMRMLEKDPDSRPTAEQVVKKLEQISDCPRMPLS